MAGDRRHRVVIIGGGFGGLYCAQRLKRQPADVTLIDRNNHHLFQPLLYQVATGGLSPANVSAPLRSVVGRQPNTRVLMEEVTGFDVNSREVTLRGGKTVPYDTLVVAAGAKYFYFGNDHWAENAPGLKSVEDAVTIRRRVLAAFERAELTDDAEEQRGLLTFVVVGGGPTGVEMAGAVAQLARHTLRRDFKNVDPASARVILAEGGPRLLAAFPEKLAGKARKSLERMGVEVWLNALATDIQPGHVVIRKDGAEFRAGCGAAVWAAGVKASPLAKALADAAGAETDKGGRVVVKNDLTLPGRPEIFAIGDMARATYPDGQTPLPGLAPVAMQQGAYAARAIGRRLEGVESEPFKYWDKGNMAIIGRASAIVDMYWLRFSGFFAWLAWLFVHLFFLVRFSNKLLVFTQWTYNYLTRNRLARLITGRDKNHPVGANF